MDDFDDLLTPKPTPAEPPELRTSIERAAARVQRHRRWLVRGRRLALLAVCYAAGLASMWYWSDRRQLPQPEVVKAIPPPEPPAPPPVSADPYRNDPPERLEKWAFLQTGEKRADLYRRAGDGFLLREDVENALKCYRKALDGAAPAQLVIADRDSWLLMSLKMARQKE